LSPSPGNVAVQEPVTGSALTVLVPFTVALCVSVTVTGTGGSMEISTRAVPVTVVTVFAAWFGTVVTVRVCAPPVAIYSRHACLRY
jgi:hypothetical protein